MKENIKKALEIAEKVLTIAASIITIISFFKS
jgi:hypothetical protein